MSATPPPTSPPDLLIVNWAKADPILRLLTAHAGFEDGQVPFVDGWSVFKVFMRLPTSLGDGGGTFQVAGTDADPEVLEAFFGRQLDDPDLGWSRIVGLSYVFLTPENTPPRDYLLDGEELWSGDFATLDQFFSAVEESEGFRTVRSREIMAVTFYMEEDVGLEHDDQ